MDKVRLSVTLGEARGKAAALRSWVKAHEGKKAGLDNTDIAVVVLDDRIDELEKRIHELENNKEG